MITARQVQAAQALLDWSPAQLAQRVGAPSGRDALRLDVRPKVEKVLARAGVEFVSGDDGSRGVMLRPPPRQG
jgi:hypothetical protein